MFLCHIHSRIFKDLPFFVGYYATNYIQCMQLYYFIMRILLLMI